ncbi:hypothetical protein Cantr_03052 [Candida viswanathii]|jgi:YebC/PmpR family DNA-binding regulatory protein|uniref:Uncharacterized protein n=1 Tax=Candida viswanathii TaxID=5486 RepID=A0A367YMI8_9ASCO|nr:hypothetical protein Cantr_03052 [Candida viswanathii]
MIRTLFARTSVRVVRSPLQGVAYTPLRFAGHSKWANIRHDKAKNDAKKNKEATLMAVRIESCVRTGGKEANSRLDQLLEKAKSLNVQKALVERAIKRGAGELTDASQQQEVQYEFMGPGGVAVIVSALTDNKARTVSLVKNAMNYFPASLSSCGFMFEKKGEIIFMPKDETESFDDVFEVALEIGAEDVEEVEFDDEFIPDKKHRFYRLLCEAGDINLVANALTAKGFKLHEAAVRYLATADTQVPFPEDSSKGYLRAIDNLDQIADVTDYYTNIQGEHEERIMSSVN